MIFKSQFTKGIFGIVGKITSKFQNQYLFSLTNISSYTFWFCTRFGFQSNRTWTWRLLSEINIHTVAGKMQNTLTSAGTVAPTNILRTITVICLWICKISICFLLDFQIRSKLHKNCWISLCSVRDSIGSVYGLKKTRFTNDGRRRRLLKKGQKITNFGKPSLEPETNCT